jgi:biopolymer transport protein ExbD
VLLIIFMVTATFLTKSAGLDVDLPKVPSANDLPAKQIELSVTKGGTIYVDGQNVVKEQLAPALEAKLQQTSIKTVVIKADSDVPYKHVVALMSAASVVGANITLAGELQQAAPVPQ